MRGVRRDPEHELRRGRGEEGATLIMAMVVMMILATLSLALQARTLASLRFIRHGQDFDAALATADAGLAQAVYYIENGQTASWESAGTHGAGSFRYYAENPTASTNPTEFIVSSKGRVGSAKHAIQAKVTRDALFPYALFGYQNLRVDGATSGNATFNFYVVGSPGANVAVGSNGLVTCNGTTASNVVFRSVGGFGGCPSTQWKQLDTPQPRIDLEPPPATTRVPTCPFLGIFTGTIDGGGGQPFICRQDVTFTGTVNVTNGPVKVYVLNDLDATGKVTSSCNSLDMSSAIINAGGLARNMQIYKSGSCPLNIGDGNTDSQITFSGVLYAPDSALVVNGGKWLTGALMVSQVKVNGAPNLKIGYDSDLQTYYGPKWKVSRYGEVASAAVSFPSNLEP